MNLSQILGTCVIGLGWLLGWYLSIGLVRSRASRKFPSSSLREGEGSKRVVSIVIPARNEAENIGGILDSLLAAENLQQRFEVKVVVVDDDSQDGTGELARRRGVEVIPVGSPRVDGWATGTRNPKSAALAQVTSRLDGEILVFFDADVMVQRDGALSDFVDRVGEDKALLISVQPFHWCGSFVESFSLYPNVLALLASGAFRGGNSTHSSTVAFGPVLLLSRSLYQTIGGHGALVGAVLDDAEMARRVRGVGGSVELYGGGSELVFRMYRTGFRSLVEGFTKNLSLGATSVTWWESSMATLWFIAGVLATQRLFSGFVDHGRPPWLALNIGLYLAVLVQHWVIGRRIGRYAPWMYGLLPVAQAGFVLLFLGSIVLVRCKREIRWRGRRISLRNTKAPE